jgi:hypothetical protein
MVVPSWHSGRTQDSLRQSQGIETRPWQCDWQIVYIESSLDRFVFSRKETT